MGGEGLERVLGRLEGKVDAIHETLRDLQDANSKTDTRLDSLEHTRTKHNTIISAVAAVAGACSGYILKTFHLS